MIAVIDQAGGSGQHCETHQDPALHLDGDVGLLFVQFRTGNAADEAVQDRCAIRLQRAQGPAQDLEPPSSSAWTSTPRPRVAGAGGSFAQARVSLAAKDNIKQKCKPSPDVGAWTSSAARNGIPRVDDPRRAGIVRTGGGSTGPDVWRADVRRSGRPPGGGQDELSVKDAWASVSARTGEHHHHAAGGRAGAYRGRGPGGRRAEERRSYSTLNGTSSITMLVRKQSGSNTVEVAHRVKALVEKLRPQLPKGVTIAIPTDNSMFTRGHDPRCSAST